VDKSCKLVLINGPNGSGKTTLIRTVALCTILAQIGCFVPCKKFILSPIRRLISVAADD